MVSETIQPLDSIAPLEEDKNKEIKDPARRDYIQGREEYTAGDFTAAAVSFHNALRGFEEQGDQLGIANASDRLGDTCMAREEYATALDHYTRAREICEVEDDSFSILALHKKMAICHRMLEQFDEALALLHDMLEHYQLTKNPQGVVDTLTVMAEVFIQQGKINDAADAYRTISSIHANFKHKRLAEEFARRAADLEEE